jgi:hypothetical protein
MGCGASFAPPDGNSKYAFGADESAAPLQVRPVRGRSIGDLVRGSPVLEAKKPANVVVTQNAASSTSSVRAEDRKYDERREEPMLGRAVTYAELCKEFAARVGFRNLSDQQRLKHWEHLKAVPCEACVDLTGTYAWGYPGQWLGDVSLEQSGSSGKCTSSREWTYTVSGNTATMYNGVVGTVVTAGSLFMITWSNGMIYATKAATAMTISGVTGVSANTINGRYQLQSAFFEGRPQWHKSGDPDLWLVYLSKSDTWNVLTTVSKEEGGGSGWMRSATQFASEPISVQAWQVFNGTSFEFQSAVSVHSQVAEVFRSEVNVGADSFSPPRRPHTSDASTRNRSAGASRALQQNTRPHTS